jgi:2-polyprenyl-3-methyl-5-hydroxy-6-metoxy-1,4-benzoquinol methylase
MAAVATLHIEIMTVTQTEIADIAACCDSTWDRHYTAAKLRTDPVYAAVEAELRGTDLPVLDIGCGIGLLAHWLRRCGIHVPVTGLDYDKRKIRSAQAMAEALSDVSYAAHDAKQGLPDHAGNVVILDILQFFTREEQDALLRLAAQRVAPGGKLLIRSGLRGNSWRYRITVACDWLARLTFWMKAAPTCYPSAEQFQEVLTKAGLRVTITPLWGRTPFFNHLIRAERPH